MIYVADEGRFFLPALAAVAVLEFGARGGCHGAGGAVRGAVLEDVDAGVDVGDESGGRGEGGGEKGVERREEGGGADHLSDRAVGRNEIVEVE